MIRGNHVKETMERPTIYELTFPNTYNYGGVWSSSVVEKKTMLVSAVFFSNGSTGSIPKETDSYVRLVRNGKSPTVSPIVLSLSTADSVKLTTPLGAIVLEKANAGDANAQFKLGFMYANGQNVSKDDIEAVRWYRRAVDQGLVDAKNNLKFMYANNRGIPHDTVEMAQWYRQAAEYGYASAQNRLGHLYDEGQGVPKDEAEATKWYRLAAARGMLMLKKDCLLLYQQIGTVILGMGQLLTSD